jgi:hypothetical protein
MMTLKITSKVISGISNYKHQPYQPLQYQQDITHAESQDTSMIQDLVVLTHAQDKQEHSITPQLHHVLIVIQAVKNAQDLQTLNAQENALITFYVILQIVDATTNVLIQMLF